MLARRLLATLPVATALVASQTLAQPIVPAADGTGTAVTPIDAKNARATRFEIAGGTPSSDGA